MNSNHNELNDYFREARKEIPVITKEEANTVISTGKFSPASGKYSPNNNLGGKIMYISAFTVAVITAGMIAFNAFINSDSGIFVNQPAKQVKSANMAITSQVLADKNGKPIHSDSKQAKYVKNFDASHKNRFDESNENPSQNNAERIFSKLDVRGVHLIEMTPAQLQSAGLADYKNGILTFYAFKETNNPLTISLLQDIISMAFISSMPKDAPGIFPRFITDDKGNRRLSLISDDDVGHGYMETFVENRDNYQVSTSRAMTMKFEDDSSVNGGNLNHKLEYDISKNKWTHQEFVSQGPDSGKKILTVEQTGLDGGGTINIIKTNNEMMDKYGLKIKINDDNELWKECVEGNDDDMIIITKITNKMLKKNGLDARYLGPVLREAIKFWEESPQVIIGKFRDHVDSVAKSNIGKQISINKKMSVEKIVINKPQEIVDQSNSETIGKSLISDSTIDIDIKVSHLQQNENDMDKRRLYMEFDTLKINHQGIIPLHSLMQNIDDYIRVNKLIPVAVSFEPGKINHILWFDPIKEFIDKLPAEIKSKLEPEVLAAGEKKEFCNSKPAIAGEDTYFDVWRSCSGAVEKLNLYPNPASGRINIGYNLTDGRNVTITLHSLTGKYIRTLQQETYQPAGSLQLSFELDGIEPGLYLITIKTDKDEQAVQRLIIQ